MAVLRCWLSVLSYFPPGFGISSLSEKLPWKQRLFCDSSLERTPFSVKMDTGIHAPPNNREQVPSLYQKCTVSAYLSCYVSTRHNHNEVLDMILGCIMAWQPWGPTNMNIVSKHWEQYFPAVCRVQGWQQGDIFRQRNKCGQYFTESRTKGNDWSSARGCCSAYLKCCVCDQVSWWMTALRQPFNLYQKVNKYNIQMSVQ